MGGGGAGSQDEVKVRLAEILERSVPAPSGGFPGEKKTATRAILGAAVSSRRRSKAEHF